MSEKVKKRIEKFFKEEFNPLDYNIPPNNNDGTAIGFELNKNPLSMAPVALAKNGSIPTKDNDDIIIAAKSLPFPIQNSEEELVSIYVAIFDYRKRVRDAGNSEVVRKSPAKSLAIRRINRRLTLALDVLQKVPRLLDKLAMQEEPYKQEGMINAAPNSGNQNKHLDKIQKTD